jgi:MazG family protein
MNLETTMQQNRSSAETADAFRGLYETIRTLRAAGGCPWDREQTPLSMRRDLIEEVFEAVDAVTSGDAQHAKEELGDVMLNAVLVAYMYEQNGDFTVSGMLDELTSKLVRRHPHVFKESTGSVCATGEVKTSGDVLNQWDKIKETVEGRKGINSILDEVPQGFPPLLKACKLQKKAGKKGFDWKSIAPVAEKVQEEFAEVQEAEVEVLKAQSEAADGAPPLSARALPAVNTAQLHLEEEFGDLLFAVVNYMRHLGVDPETAMDRANRKFYRRFSYVEQKMAEKDIPMDDTHLSDEERLWDEAKRNGL